MKKTILIVDDEIPLAKALQRVLERHEFQVLLAENVDKAREILQASPVDLCITDLALPGKSGLDFLRDLRAHATLSTLPVVVLSGFSDQSQAQASVFRPFRILKKPASMDELLRTLRDGLHLPQPTK